MIPLLRANYLLVAPWIVLSIPSAALLGQPVVFTVVIAALGLLGIMWRSRRTVIFASSCLLLLLVWEKAAGDLFALGAPDTAVFILQFMGVLFFMEASLVTLTFDSTNRILASKKDEISTALQARALEWAQVQLVQLGKLTLAAIGLSLGLLVLGSLVSVSFNQLGFTAFLVLVSVVVVLFLLTNRREPAGVAQRER